MKSVRFYIDGEDPLCGPEMILNIEEFTVFATLFFEGTTDTDWHIVIKDIS